MTVYRATKTLTLGKNQNVEADAWVSEANPTQNYGNDPYTKIGGQIGTDVAAGLARLQMPEAPEDCEKDAESYEGIVSITLKLYFYQKTATSTSPQGIRIRTVLPGDEGWDEDAVSHTTDRPGTGVFISDNSISLTTFEYKNFVLTLFREFGLIWNDTLSFWLYDTRDQLAKFSDFRSREHTTTAELPYLVIEYKAKAPAQITDLAISPDPDDAKRPKLSWTPSSDENFSHYEIWRKVGGGAWAQVGSDITVQGIGEYVDTSSITENVVVYYKIREENTDTCYNESNEVWLTRPDVATFLVSDTTPDVLQELTFTVAASSIPTTPTPVSNVEYTYVFGTSAQSDGSSATVPDLTRTHRYGYFGSQTPSVQITNSLGFKSNATTLTTGGPTLTVSDIVPIAVIKASPVTVGLNIVVRFFGDESYAPAGNREFASTNAYEWDKDYSVSFSLDDATTLPYKDYSWSGAGTKSVALRVKDAASAYSTHVIIQVVVAAVSTTDLDGLADGYEVIDVDRSRTVIVQEGIEAKKVVRGSEKIVGVSIGGLAFTDVGANNIADDIETLEDILTNNKRVSLSVHGTVRYGALSSFRTHTEGGWDLIHNWTATVVLE